MYNKKFRDHQGIVRYNIGRGLRPLRELTKHFTARTDDSHETAPRLERLHRIKPVQTELKRQGRVRFLRGISIKPHSHTVCINCRTISLNFMLPS